MDRNVLEWNKETVIQFIKGCREDEGYPMFKTSYGGVELPFVIGVCWGGRGKYPDSVKFINVPKDDIEFLREGFHDWQRLLMKWGETELLEELSHKGLYLSHAGKLPRVVKM